MLYYILYPLWNWRKVPVLFLWHFQKTKVFLPATAVGGKL